MEENPRRRQWVGGLGADFGRLWLASAVSNGGDGLRVSALPLLATTITRDPVLIAAVVASAWAPWFMFGLHGGAWVDRAEKSALIRRVQWSRMAVGAVLAAWVLAGDVPLEAVYATAFLIGTGEVIVDVGFQALVPQFVAETHLDRANSRMIATEIVGNELTGPPVGGFFFGVAPATPFLLDAISYGISAAALGRLDDRIPSRSAASDGTRNLTGEVMESLRWVWRHPWFRAITVWGALFNVGSWGAYSILVLYALDVLGLSGFGYGLLLSSYAIGGLAGTAIAPRVAQHVGRGRTILIGSVTSGLLTSAVGLVGQPLLVAALICAASASGILVNVIGRSLRQSLTPSHLLGRVTASGRVVVYGAIPVGAVLGGWAAAELSLASVFIIGGLIMTTVSVGLAPWLRESSLEAARRQS